MAQRPSSTFRILPTADHAAVLAATPLFGVLDAAALEWLAGQVERVNVAGGDVLLREGDAGDCMYVVVVGRLAVVADAPDGRELRSAEIGRGETVGEMALVSGSPRWATVRAARDSLLLRFSKDTFDELLERYPRTAMQLARSIVRRLEESMGGDEVRPSSPGTIAVAPAGRDAPVSFVAKTLADSLSQTGATLHLTSARVERMVSNTSAATGAAALDASVIAWLDEQEAVHDVVIYECDPEPTPWTARCLRQADRVLLAARATSDTSHTQIEAELFSRPNSANASPIELVLVHASDAGMPERTDAWLATRPVLAHRHIREGSIPDANRLARLVVGRGTGLVFSGGGARGFAHLGVLRALEECGVAIDCVGGTSMGAIIAGLFACGYGHEERVDRARSAFFQYPPNKDYTLPVIAMVHGARSNALMRSMYGETLIENLWTPFFCVSTNLTRAESHVTREGPLWRWVRASCSPPGLAPPIFAEGQMFADGGILDNLPVGTMRRTAGIGVTIASDTGAAANDASRNLPSFDSVSGWSAFWSRVSNNPRHAALPTLPEILMLTSTINSIPAGHEAKRLADLYLHPPASGVKAAEWKAIDRLVDAGYRYALDRVREWQESQ